GGLVQVTLAHHILLFNALPVSIVLLFLSPLSTSTTRACQCPLCCLVLMGGGGLGSVPVGGGALGPGCFIWAKNIKNVPRAQLAKMNSTTLQKHEKKHKSTYPSKP
ncbi:unnamed protein product, partial [Ilex paraguariensis]